MLAEISANTEEAVAKQEVAQTKEEDLAIMTEKITVQKSEAEAVTPPILLPLRSVKVIDSP